MILSDRDIRRLLEVGDIVIDPLDDPDIQIQPASVDLRLGREFLTFKRSNIQCIHPKEGYEVEQYVQETTLPGSSRDGQQTLHEFERTSDDAVESVQEEFILHPGDFVLGTTKERVGIPDDLIAHVEGRSSLGRLAIVVHASLPADEELFVWTPDDGFGLYPIGDLVASRRPAWAVAFDPATLRVQTHRVTDYLTNPVKPIYRITLASGREVHVTADHNLFTLDAAGGVTRLPSEAAEDELVMVPRRLPASPSEAHSLSLSAFFEGTYGISALASDGLGTAAISPPHREAETASFSDGTVSLSAGLNLTPDFARVVGAYLVAGSVTGETLILRAASETKLRQMAQWCTSQGAHCVWEHVHSDPTVTVTSSLLATLFRELVGPATATQIPPCAWDWPNEVLEGLLDGMMCATGGDQRIVHVRTETLASDVMYLATRLGQPVSLEQTDGTFLLTIQDDTERKDELPVPGDLLADLDREAELTHNTHRPRQSVERDTRARIDRATLARLERSYRKQGVNTRRLAQVLDGDIRFERVVSVERTDRREPTFDLEVRPNGRVIENFLGGRGGVFLSNTAGLCDPGFEGKITLELSNLGTAPVALTPDMRIAQLTFTELTSPAERPYGAERGSKYQGQTGPQASRIQRDREFGGDQ